MRLRNLLLTVQYCGSRYHGFQVQKNALAVATVIQDAVETVFKHRLDIKGCSRTDTGVHANRFALSLRTSLPIPCDAVVRAMNVNLPMDIAVLGCREVEEDFHPRYSCIGKRYIYKIWTGAQKNAFLSDRAYHYTYPLDETRMDALARAYIGTFDFKSFCSAGGSVEDTVRTVSDARVWRKGELVTFSVTGTGFLYNMVRIMTGTLLEMQLGCRPPAALLDVIGARNRLLAGPTAPAHGLYLDAVFYPDFALTEEHINPVLL